MMIEDPILSLEGRFVVANLTGGGVVRGKLISYRGDMLTIEAKYPRPRRVIVNRYEMISIEIWHKPRQTGADRRRSDLFWK